MIRNFTKFCLVDIHYAEILSADARMGLGNGSKMDCDICTACFMKYLKAQCQYVTQTWDGDIEVIAEEKNKEDKDEEEEDVMVHDKRDLTNVLKKNDFAARAKKAISNIDNIKYNEKLVKFKKQVQVEEDDD